MSYFARHFPCRTAFLGEWAQSRLRRIKCWQSETEPKEETSAGDGSLSGVEEIIPLSESQQGTTCEVFAFTGILIEIYHWLQLQPGVESPKDSEGDRGSEQFYIHSLSYLKHFARHPAIEITKALLAELYPLLLETSRRSEHMVWWESLASIWRRMLIYLQVCRINFPLCRNRKALQPRFQHVVYLFQSAGQNVKRLFRGGLQRGGLTCPSSYQEKNHPFLLVIMEYVKFFLVIPLCYGCMWA